MHPGARLGPHEIVAPLGAGGMGDVDRARDTRLGREVAAKLLRADGAGDAERVRRFEQEERTVASLSHPNILALGCLLYEVVSGRRALRRASAVEIVRPDPAPGEAGLRFPCFLPDGKHFLYVSSPRKQAGFDIYLGALDSEEHRRVGSAGSAPVRAGPGCLLFSLGDRLVARRFDASRGRLVGDGDEVQRLHQLRPLAGGSAARGDDPPHQKGSTRRAASGLLVKVHPPPPVCRSCHPRHGGRVPDGPVPLLNNS